MWQKHTKTIWRYKSGALICLSSQMGPAGNLCDVQFTQHRCCRAPASMLPFVVYSSSVHAAEPRITELTLQRYVSFFQPSMDRLLVPCLVSTAVLGFELFSTVWPIANIGWRLTSWLALSSSNCVGGTVLPVEQWVLKMDSTLLWWTYRVLVEGETHGEPYVMSDEKDLFCGTLCQSS